MMYVNVRQPYSLLVFKEKTWVKITDLSKIL